MALPAGFTIGTRGRKAADKSSLVKLAQQGGGPHLADFSSQTVKQWAKEMGHNVKVQSVRQNGAKVTSKCAVTFIAKAGRK